jgi:hypothetical protein
LKPLCVIPARGGSKRLPSKNLRLLAGVPLLVHTIRAAQNSEVFEKVWVSTEDELISTVAKEAGALVHRRPQHLASDIASATEVCLELDKSLISQSVKYDAIVCLQPSSPLRNEKDICASWKQIMKSKCQFLVSATPIDPHYFHWALHQNKGAWCMYFRDLFMKERLLLPPVYRPNGAIKIAQTEALRKTKNFFGVKLDVYMMPENRSIHIAEEWDLFVAECVLAKKTTR